MAKGPLVLLYFHKLLQKRNYTYFLYSASLITLDAKASIFIKSIGEISIPIEDLEASKTALAFAESPMISSNSSNCASESSFRFFMKDTTRQYM